MTDNLLIHADSQRDADMFVATGVTVVDPFTYLERNGQGVIVASVLEADVIRRDSRASEVWTDDQFGGRELMAKGWSYHDAEMEVVRRVLEKAGAQAVVVPPSFPLSLADYLRGKGHTVTPDRDLFERRPSWPRSTSPSVQPNRPSDRCESCWARQRRRSRVC
jgi:Xaa-Pro aminopeptidase